MDSEKFNNLFINQQHARQAGNNSIEEPTINSPSTRIIMTDNVSSIRTPDLTAAPQQTTPEVPQQTTPPPSPVKQNKTIPLSDIVNISIISNEKGPATRKRSIKHSEIFTSIPVKKRLEEKQERQKEKKRKQI